MNLCVRLWANEEGFVVSSELILLATLLVLGMITGLDTIRDQVVQELADVADAFSEISQTYSYSGVTAHSASTAGSAFEDQHDFCEAGNAAASGDQTAGNEPQCIEINSVVATPENDN